MQKHYLLTFIVVIGLLVLATPTLAYSTDFEAFALNTPAASLNIPGVAFSGTGWRIFGPYNGAPYFSGNALDQNSLTPSNLTITFATPQSSVSFGYGTCPTFTANALLAGKIVDTATTTGICTNGTITLSNPAGIDSVVVVLAYGGTVIDNLITTPAKVVSQTAVYCAINDGRINNLGGLDCAAPVAIYPKDNGYDIYGINPDGGAGDFALRISADDIDAAGVPGDINVTLADGTNPFNEKRILVSRLTTGEFQVNTYYADGKPYIFVWGDNGTYHVAD